MPALTNRSNRICLVVATFALSPTDLLGSKLSSLDTVFVINIFVSTLFAKLHLHLLLLGFALAQQGVELLDHFVFFIKVAR